jgi:hypothetical protein
MLLVVAVVGVVVGAVVVDEAAKGWLGESRRPTKP